MRTSIFQTAMLAMLIASTASFAASRNLVLQTSDVVAQQKAIRAEVEAKSGRYADVPAATRKQIMVDQDKLFRLLEGTASTTELSESKKTEVFNLLDAITTTINGDGDDEKLVCTRESRTGSNFMTRVCRTQAQIRQEKESAEYKMKEANRKICNDQTKSC